MLTQLKNQLLEVFQKHDISLDLINVEEEYGNFIVRVADTPLKFIITDTEDDFYKFNYSYTRFRPGFPISSSHEIVHFGMVLLSFDVWVKNDVRNIIKEKDSPDLWEHHKNLGEAIPSPAPPEDEIEEFTEDEKNQIRVSIDEFRLLVEENFQPIEEQLKDFNERLDYLSNAVDRLNRFDWRALLITTGLDIVIAFTLDPEGARRLYELLQQAFSGVIGFLS